MDINNGYPSVSVLKSCAELPTINWTGWVWILRYDRRSAGQSVLEQSTHLRLTTRSWLLSDICGFVDLGRPLLREDGSVVYNCCWSSPAQSFSGPSPVGLVAIFYCLRFKTSFSSPPTTRRVTVEVFDPASTRVTDLVASFLFFINPRCEPRRNTPFPPLHV
jgi:hypothetical protein